MHQQKSNSVEQLIFSFSKLPGLGQRSARRIVLHLIQDKDVRMRALNAQIVNVMENIKKCQFCGNLDIELICRICKSPERDPTAISVVESVAELWALERSGIFQGRYHVLGGALSANNNNTPESLNLPKLLNRIKTDNVREIILATNYTLDGQMTAFFIVDYLKATNVKISRLASGIPIGSELDYLDEGTLSAALNSRQLFTE